MILFRLLRWTSGFAFFPILIVLYYGFKAVQGVFNGQKWAFNEWIEIVGHELYGLAGDWSRNIIIASLIALLLTNSAIHQLVGINNLNIEPDGTYCFYVAATKNGEKTYTLPAQIRVEEEHEEDDHERGYDAFGNHHDASRGHAGEAFHCVRRHGSDLAQPLAVEIAHGHVS